MDVTSQTLLLLLEDWFSGSHGGARDAYWFDDPNNKVRCVRFCLCDRHLIRGLSGFCSFSVRIFYLRGHRRMLPVQSRSSTASSQYSTAVRFLSDLVKLSRPTLVSAPPVSTLSISNLPCPSFTNRFTHHLRRKVSAQSVLTKSAPLSKTTVV